jgi:hypothetical protein
VHSQCPYQTWKGRQLVRRCPVSAYQAELELGPATGVT